jgi:hypothetical protein
MAEGWKYFRLCFAAVSEDEVEAGAIRFAGAAEAFWKIKTKKELEDIESQDAVERTEEGMVNMGLNWAC